MNAVNIFLVLGLAAGLLLTERISSSPVQARRRWMVGCWTGLSATLLWSTPWTFQQFSPGLNSWILGLGFWLGAGAYGLSDPRFLAHQLDEMVPGLAISMAIARVGCWFEGCHAGGVTKLPWGTIYGPQSWVFTRQIASGTIDWNALQSLPVQPLPLYESVAALLFVSGCLAMRKQWVGRHPGGMLLVASVSGYAVLRQFILTVGATTTEKISHLPWAAWILIALAWLYLLLSFLSRHRFFAIRETVGWAIPEEKKAGQIGR